MSRKFLTPVNLPSGTDLPLSGRAGDLFYKLDDELIYAHNGTAWVPPTTDVALSDLTDTTITTPDNFDTLIYNSTAQKWENIGFADMLAAFGFFAEGGGFYNTTSFAGIIDGGLYNTTVFDSVVDGGNESSF